MMLVHYIKYSLILNFIMYLMSGRSVGSFKRSLSGSIRLISRLHSTSMAYKIDKSVFALMQEEVQLSLINAFGKEYQTTDPMIFPGKMNMGDYQTSIAMTLTKQLKLPPKEIANKLIEHLSYGQVIEKADISGPGFINLHVSPHFLQSRLVYKLIDPGHRSGIPKVTRPQRVIVDFSSPNIAKEMHVGHLRSTIIGDCISKVLEFLGHDVLRLNHVGDWGTQFGMLIRYLKETHPEMIRTDLDTKEAAQALKIGDLVEFYKAAKVRFDADPAFQDAARLEVVKLQAGDQENKQIWSAICEKSRSEFQSIYDLLGVSILERGESFYNPFLSDIVTDLKMKGHVQESEGAQVIFLPGYKNSDNTPLPLIVQKSDGGFLYATTDLAAVRHRIFTEKAERVIYVTDAGQAQHFSMVFDAVKQTGLMANAPTEAAGMLPQLTHVPFGLVLGEDGKKIKTRSGESVKLKELLQEAIKIAEEGFVNRLAANPAVVSTTLSAEVNSGNSSPVTASSSSSSSSSTSIISQETIAEKAKIMGIAAVKYADLSMNRESNYRFSFEKMLSLNGNTAPYMLYAYVRILGIQRKAVEKLAADGLSSAVPVSSGRQDVVRATFAKIQDAEVASKMLLLSESEEISLAKHLVKIDEVLYEVADKLYPHKLCEYIFELSQKFNQFYEKCPVIKAASPELQISRTALCTITADTLKLSLDLLGIDTLEVI